MDILHFCSHYCAVNCLFQVPMPPIGAPLWVSKLNLFLLLLVEEKTKKSSVPNTALSWASSRNSKSSVSTGLCTKQAEPGPFCCAMRRTTGCSDGSAVSPLTESSGTSVSTNFNYHFTNYQRTGAEVQCWQNLCFSAIIALSHIPRETIASPTPSILTVFSASRGTWIES